VASADAGSAIWTAFWHTCQICKHVFWSFFFLIIFNYQLQYWNTLCLPMLISEEICHCCQKTHESKSESVDIGTPRWLLIVSPAQFFLKKFTGTIHFSYEYLCFALLPFKSLRCLTGLLCSCPVNFKIEYIQTVGEKKEMPNMHHTPTVLLTAVWSKISIFLPESPGFCCGTGSS